MQPIIGCYEFGFMPILEPDFRRAVRTHLRVGRYTTTWQNQRGTKGRL